ncbi:type 1 glutamine amidotransferase [Aurantimonas sp. Leaf443]|uniref:type 1 glutamine amidotransferase n=1 Tax=Aurantimonas sp. Leaf443 TaxID=1736378 RepID=UPI0006FC71E8|nr:type 1 glutamine amidotransferase [Aurantimonas sp. Leaf443]KQT88450.1 glutamine amidotransferase [Aurantimonas sp. Leaf443]
MPASYLVVASETPTEREARRREVGASSDETFAETLRALDPGCHVELCSCVDGGDAPSVAELRRHDAVFFSGSPISMYEATPQARSAAAFMRRVFSSGVPSFGSCAGLQIAVVAAGGATKPRRPGTEAAFARGIVATEAGRSHPLLKGRPLSFEAPAMHSDEVARLPDGAILLARTDATPVQAAEIRHGGGVFWGVQYHPELTLAEIAAALRRQAGDLVGEGLARDEGALLAHAARIDALDSAPERRDLAWQLGLDAEVTDPRRRMTEIRNFIAAAGALRTAAAGATPPA